MWLLQIKTSHSEPQNVLFAIVTLKSESNQSVFSHFDLVQEKTLIWMNPLVWLGGRISHSLQVVYSIRRIMHSIHKIPLYLPVLSYRIVYK